MSDGNARAVDAPQLRTLLLTDLCDSTGAVEKLGDSGAAAFFRAHDGFVLELQRRWRGRLIDRSDGLLLIFERPLDGLGFALDYRAGLEALGKAHGITPLRARAGLHVGEVLIWRNSDEAVQAGAKSMEVEGLAKPLAARLMQLARPGQILLSSVAGPLVRRAARELGPRGEALQWRSHGRWRFKGMPEVQEVHEVGEPGLAPLRAPSGDAKARRDQPLWRRPMALMAEAVAVLALGVALWIFTRSEPAIAFAERDWVVVADLRNATDQGLLDGSVEQALRLSLGQSRHINLLSDAKVRDTLSRMRRSPDTPLDRELASEIAIRDGAWGVVVPTVTQIGERLHVGLELVDPRSREVVYVATADGSGVDSILASVDEAAAALRTRLGEARLAVARDSRPLPQVATASLDALRAYALGQEAYAQGNFVQAADFYQRAVALDPDFALAHIGIARAYNVLDRLAEGLPHLRRAQELRDNLSGRDQMYLDAWAVQVDDPGRALDAWMLMSRMYPDFFQAHANVGYALDSQNRHGEAVAFAAKAAVPQSEFAPLSLDLLGRLRLALGDREPAYQALKAASDRGLSTAQAWLAVWHAVGDDFAAAEAAWPADGQLRLTLFERVSIFLDQQRWDAAHEEATRVQGRAQGNPARARQSLMPAAIVAWATGEHGEARDQVQRMVATALESVAHPNNAMDQRDDAVLALYAAILGQRLGHHAPARRVVQALEADQRLAQMQPISQLLTVVRARMALAEDRPAQALAILDTIQDGTESIQARVVRMEAAIATGDLEAAGRLAAWLAPRRGLAYAEFGCAWCQQGMNVLDARLAAVYATRLADPHAAPEVAAQLRLPPAEVLAGAAASSAP